MHATSRSLRRATLLTLVATGLAAPAHALEPVPLTDGLDLAVHGEYRLLPAAVSPLDVQNPALYPDAARLGGRGFGEHRLRLAPALEWRAAGEAGAPATGLLQSVALRAEFDVLSGHLWGDGGVARDPLLDESTRPRQRDDGLETDGFLVRQLYADVRTSVGVLRVGRQTSRWGLGLLADDGAGDPKSFGQKYYGDLVERVLFATRPLGMVNDWPLNLALAADRVAHDDTADRARKDRINNYVAGLLWDGARLTAGDYFVVRTGKNRDDDETRAYAFDHFVRWRMTDPGTLGGYVEGELAFVWGWTDVARSGTQPRRADLEQLGAIVRLGVAGPVDGALAHLDAWLEGGYASGDANPSDTEQHAFSFDRDYRVGLVLFPEVLAAQSAASAHQLRDPGQEHRQFPVDGAELLPTNGAVRNAVYLNAVATARPEFAPPLRLMAGVLWAQAPQAVIDPNQFGLTSTLVNPLGGSAGGRTYGTELDFGADWTQSVGCGCSGCEDCARCTKGAPAQAASGASADAPRRCASLFDVIFGVQYGVLLPGDAFEDASGDRPSPPWTVVGRAALRW